MFALTWTRQYLYLFPLQPILTPALMIVTDASSSGSGSDGDSIVTWDNGHHGVMWSVLQCARDQSGVMMRTPGCLECTPQRILQHSINQSLTGSGPRWWLSQQILLRSRTDTSLCRRSFSQVTSIGIDFLVWMSGSTPAPNMAQLPSDHQAEPATPDRAHESWSHSLGFGEQLHIQWPHFTMSSIHWPAQDVICLQKLVQGKG